MNIMVKSLAPMLAIALLTACGQSDSKKTADQELVPVPGSKASVTGSQTFTCEGDMPVTAFYGTNAEGDAELSLIVSGDEYRLHPTPAPSGKRYASPYGAGSDTGIIWWEHGEEALLQQAPSAEVDNPDAGVTARQCQVKSDQPAGESDSK